MFSESRIQRDAVSLFVFVFYLSNKIFTFSVTTVVLLISDIDIKGSD